LPRFAWYSSAKATVQYDSAPVTIAPVSTIKAMLSLLHFNENAPVIRSTARCDNPASDAVSRARCPAGNPCDNGIIHSRIRFNPRAREGRDVAEVSL
jgi:hypothetical protein